MGHRELAGQRTDEILTRFGRPRAKALSAYRQFVADGIALGRRSELSASGLRRRQPEAEGTAAFDERILGTCEFVKSIRGEVSEPLTGRPNLTLDELVKRIAVLCAVTPDVLYRRTRMVGAAEARSLICFVAVRQMGYSGADVARWLRMSRSGVTIAVTRGAELWNSDPSLRGKIEG